MYTVTYERNGEVLCKHVLPAFDEADAQIRSEDWFRDNPEYDSGASDYADMTVCVERTRDA